MLGALIRILERRRLARERIRGDAMALVLEHGLKAYIVAREMARAERSGRLVASDVPLDHWDRVRREVKRLEGRL